MCLRVERSGSLTTGVIYRGPFHYRFEGIVIRLLPRLNWVRLLPSCEEFGHDGLPPAEITLQGWLVVDLPVPLQEQIELPSVVRTNRCRLVAIEIASHIVRIRDAFVRKLVLEMGAIVAPVPT